MGDLGAPSLEGSGQKSKGKEKLSVGVKGPQKDDCVSLAETVLSAITSNQPTVTDAKGGKQNNKGGTSEGGKQNSKGGTSDTQWIPWDTKEFLLTEQYFRDVCKLPSKGIVPALIDESVVTDKLLEECFGPKQKRNGYKVENCTRIHLDEVSSLCIVTDGHDKTVHEHKRIGVTLAKGLYLERILKKPVNWAAYAVSKLKGQILHAYNFKDPKPTGPPIIRVPAVYRSPQYLVDAGVVDAFEGVDEVEGNLPVVSGGVVESLSSGKGSISHYFSIPRLVPEAVSPYKPCMKNILQTPSTKMSSEFGNNSIFESTTCNPPHDQLVFSVASTPFLMLMNDCMSVELTNTEKALELMNKEHAAAILELAAIAEKQSTASADFAKALAERMLAEEQMDEWDKKKRSLVEEKVGLAAQLEEYDDDETAEYDHTETELKELNHQLCITDGQVTTSEQRINGLQDVIFSSQVIQKKLAAERLVIENKSKAKEIAISSARERIRAVKAEYDILSCHFEKGWTCLKPKIIPTTPIVTNFVFKITSCPVCCCGFHCNNWLPTSCGLTYHPACLVPLLAKTNETPTCLVCKEAFHPDWLEAWGIECKTNELRDIADLCDLGMQRAHFNEAMVDLYKSGALTLSQRRLREYSKALQRTRYYSKGVEDKDAAKAELMVNACLKHPGMEASEKKHLLEEHVTESSEGDVELLPSAPQKFLKPKVEKDEQVLTLEPKSQGLEVKGNKKRKGSMLGESPRTGRVVTRNATKAELATSDSTPVVGHAIVVKDLSDVVTPPYFRESPQAAGANSKKACSPKVKAGRFSKRKLSLK